MLTDTFLTLGVVAGLIVLFSLILDWIFSQDDDDDDDDYDGWWDNYRYA